MKRILILSGPNLNMLGVREKSVYGGETLDSIHERIGSRAAELGVQAICIQSNSEAKLCGMVISAPESFDGIILNAGAYTHYSEKLKSTVHTSSISCIEVHLSNIFAREQLRHKSLIADVCGGSIAGFGADGYLMALEALCINGKIIGKTPNHKQ